MLEVNIGKMTYQVHLYTEDGTTYDLSPVLTSVRWEDGASEFSARGSFSCVNTFVGGTWLHSIAKIGCLITVFSQWGDGVQQVYQGRIWEWTYTSGTQKEISISTYDNGKFLLQSKDSFYFSAGLDTKTILGTICEQWGVPLDYQWTQTMTHEKKVFDQESIAEIILSLLEEVSAHCDETAVCLWKNDALSIVGQGSNDAVFSFDMYQVSSTQNKISVNSLVTKVKVLGTADDDGRTAVEAVVDGDQSFGILQHTIIRDSDKTLEAAIAEAEIYLEEHNSPEEDITIEVVDLPFLRKGDLVKVCAGNLIDDFYVLGVCHDGTQKQMTLTLERVNS